MERVVGGDEAGDVDEVFGEGEVAGLIGFVGLDAAHIWSALFELCDLSATIWDAGCRWKMAAFLAGLGG